MPRRHGTPGRHRGVQGARPAGTVLGLRGRPHHDCRKLPPTPVWEPVEADARKRCARRRTRCPATRPGVWHAWAAVAARQSVTVGRRHAHPIRKNVGAAMAAWGQLGGNRMAASPLNRHPSTAWPARGGGCQLGPWGYVRCKQTWVTSFHRLALPVYPKSPKVSPRISATYGTGEHTPGKTAADRAVAFVVWYELCSEKHTCRL